MMRLVGSRSIVLSVRIIASDFAWLGRPDLYAEHPPTATPDGRQPGSYAASLSECWQTRRAPARSWARAQGVMSARNQDRDQGAQSC